jgi:hypothetical protein
LSIHGPAKCERPCVECDPGHHWIEMGTAEWAKEDDFDHDDVELAVLKYDREHGTDHLLAFYACKHCPAWCELDDLDEGSWGGAA